MPKIVEEIIYDCFQCPYCDYDLQDCDFDNPIFWCSKVEGKPEVDIHTIPSWCPLKEVGA